MQGVHKADDSYLVAVVWLPVGPALNKKTIKNDFLV